MRHLQQLVYIDAVARTGSIRRAAQSLAITSTALNRRILSVEEELGTPIFERTGKGVRLSVAGEIFIHHIRQQISDLERVKSQIADLHGERRGRVSIACGQALMHSFLPSMVSNYRDEHPYVDFSLRVCGRDEATDRLADFSADLAVIFEPDVTADLSVLLKVPQCVYAIMSNQHPLATKPALMLGDCIEYPLALPTRRSGLRALIEVSAARQELSPWVAVESDSADFLLKCLEDQRSVGFQLPITFARSGLPSGTTAVKVSTHELALGSLVVLTQKARVLPVAAARFLAILMDQLAGQADELGAVEAVEAVKAVGAVERAG